MTRTKRQWKQIDLKKEKKEHLLDLIKELQHHKATTVGLWAIDQNPKNVSYDWIK